MEATTTPLRVCTSCGDEFERYGITKRARLGRAICRKCFNKQQAARRRANRNVPREPRPANYWKVKVCPHCRETFERYGFTECRPSGRALCPDCQRRAKRKWVREHRVRDRANRLVLSGAREGNQPKERRPVMDSQRMRW